MRIHYLQHVHFEGPGSIKDWSARRNHILTGSKSYLNVDYPEVKEIDLLIILGGPMNIYDEKMYPWLATEKEFIAKAIKEGIPIVGICLGAQLLADQLGGQVFKNKQKEIGWMPIEMTIEAKHSELFSTFPENPTVFHWHGDTFTLPEGATRIAQSAGCLNQAFVYNERIVGLQFHLECTRESIEMLLEHCSSDIEPGFLYVQSQNDIRHHSNQYTTNASNLFSDFLDELTTKFTR